MVGQVLWEWKLLAAVVLASMVWVFVAPGKLREYRYVMQTGILCIAGIVFWFTVNHILPGPGAMASFATLQSASGKEYLVGGEYGGVFDLWQVTFFVRTDDHWNCYYLDHETFRWGRTTLVESDPGLVQVWKGGSMIATNEEESGQFHNEESGETVDGPMWVISRNWPMDHGVDNSD